MYLKTDINLNRVINEQTFLEDVTCGIFVSLHQFLGLLQIMLWVIFLWMSLILSVFIKLMKTELKWTLCMLFFKVLRRLFWVFCKVNKNKNHLWLTLLFNRIYGLRWKTWVCLKVSWMMIKYWNVWEFNQVTFFEHLFGNFTSGTM